MGAEGDPTPDILGLTGHPELAPRGSCGEDDLRSYEGLTERSLDLLRRAYEFDTGDLTAL